MQFKLDKNTLKILFRILIIPISLIAFILYIHYSLTWEVFYEYIRFIKIKYLFLAIGCSTASLLFDHICYFVLRFHFQKKFRFWWVSHACLRAQFWEMLTPGTFAVGPVIHTNCMKKQGVSISDSATIILSRQIIYHITLISTSISLLAISFKFFSGKLTVILWILYLISLIVSIATIIVYILVPRNSKFILNLVSKFLHFLYKIKFIRKESRLEYLLLKSQTQVEGLKNNMSKLDYKFSEWVLCLLFSLISLVSTYNVHFFLAKMLSINIEVNYIIAITAISLLSCITCMIPVPGGFGTTDLAYVRIFCPIFGNSMSEVMMLFSRLITYYYPILLGSVMFTIKTPTVKKLENQNAINNQEVHNEDCNRQ